MARSVAQMAQAQKAKLPEAFARYGTITAATKAVGVGRRTHYNWLETDPEYAAAFADATEAFRESLEAEMFRRAVDGVDEPVFDDKGRLVTTRKKYSDTLLIFALKGAAPAKYKDNASQTVINGDVNQTLIIEHKDDWRA